MGASDLQIQVWQHKLACVIEPTLVLARPSGPVLALGLARAFEAWLTRSFWQVLDASDLLAQPNGCATDDDTVEPDPQALASWIEMRDSTDAGSWTLRWLGDNVAESQLRDGGRIELVERYEALLAALLARLAVARVRTAGDAVGPRWNVGLERSSAAADALALSACLGGAMVLCAGDADAEPAPIDTLRMAALSVTAVDGLDDTSLLAAERMVVRQALAAAGLAPLVQTLPRLAAVHVLVQDDVGTDQGDAWADARAWWYWL